MEESEERRIAEEKVKQLMSRSKRRECLSLILIIAILLVSLTTLLIKIIQYYF